MGRTGKGLVASLVLVILPLAAHAQPARQPPPAQQVQQAPPPGAQPAQPPAAPAAPPAVAPPAQPTAGIEFELATEFLSPNDSRVDGGSSVFRLAFHPEGGNLLMFYERISETFTFKNGGPPVGVTTVPSVSGESTIDGVGVGYVFGVTRFEIMTGRATTNVTAVGPASTSLASSDPVMDVRFFYTYHPAQQHALIDFGLAYRIHRLSAAEPGNQINTESTQNKQLNDLGGLAVRLGIGYGF